MKKIITIVTIFFLFCWVRSHAQYDANAAFPEVGKPMPSFLLKNIKYYSKDKATLSDFKGEWLMLDFWGRTCSSCIKSFPAVNTLQQQFKDQLQIVEVCYVLSTQYNGGDEEQMYSRYKKLWHLTMPCAFDSLVCQRFNISGLPHIIIISPDGIVKAVTNTIDREAIQGLMAGKSPVLGKTYSGNGKTDSAVKRNDNSSPFLINGNGGSDSSYSYRSILTPYQNDAGFYTADMREQLRATPDRIIMVNHPLLYLYFFAFTGHRYNIPFKNSDYQKFYARPTIEAKDSARLDRTMSPKNQENMYCYSLTMPPLKYQDENRAHFKAVMQRELENYFGYDVELETHDMPCLRLTTTSDQAKVNLKTKGGIEPSGGSWISMTYVNQPISAILDKLDYGHTRDIHPIILIDNTGISENIDLKLNVPFNAPWSDIRKELRKSGLDLIPGKIPMQVLVIRDPKPGTLVSEQRERSK